MPALLRLRLDDPSVWVRDINGIAISQGNKRFRAYRLLSTEPRALASGLLQAAWRPLADARGSVPAPAFIHILCRATHLLPDYTIPLGLCHNDKSSRKIWRPVVGGTAPGAARNPLWRKETSHVWYLQPAGRGAKCGGTTRSEEHTSELQSLR